MTSYRIAVIPGDGVGKEVATEAIRVLEAVANVYGFSTATDFRQLSRYLRFPVRSSRSRSEY